MRRPPPPVSSRRPCSVEPPSLLPLTERGAVTPFTLALLLGIGALAVAVSVLGGAATAQRRAESAADLAALAGARAVQQGRDACSAVRGIAARSSAEVTGCVVTGQTVTVRLTLWSPLMFGRRILIAAEARAGPQPP